MIKAVIFDLDGVLVHTDKFHYLAWKALADKLGIYFDETINNRCRGVSRMESLDIVLERANKTYTQEEKVVFATEKNEIYKRYLATMTPVDVTDDVRNTILSLKNRGIKVAIGSSSKNTRFILERVGLIDLFDAISDGNNISHSKPDPEVFLKAAEFLGIEPEYCMIVEDAVSGVEAGKRAGMTTTAVGDVARAHVADNDIEKLSDILDIVK